MTRSPQQLSRAFAAGVYRATTATAARYTPITGRITCDECAARQHETRGDAPTRAPGKSRRDLPTTDGPDTALLLCRAHEQMWRERDYSDRDPAGGAR